MKQICFPQTALIGFMVVGTVLLFLPLAENGNSDGTRIGKPDLTIWAVQVDPDVIGPGVLEYPDSYNSDDYIDEQTTMDVSEEVPNEGDLVHINLTVFNIGLESGSAEVEFFDGPRETGTFIGNDTVSVKALNYDIATTLWDTLGIHGEEHEIFAYLTPDDPGNETNPDNNQGSKEVLINFYPTASISGYSVKGSQEMEVREGDTVVFDGSGSTDTQRDIDAGLLYIWDFDDPLSNSTNRSPVSGVNLTRAEYLFGDAGMYSVELTLEDQHGARRSHTIDIEIVNLPPRPVITHDAGEIFEDEVVRFDGSLTEDSDHDLALMEYRWDMGDGNVSSWSNEPFFEHSYPRSGEYTVSLLARDDEGATGSTSLPLTVYNAEPLGEIESIEINGEPIYSSPGELEVMEDDVIRLIAGSVSDTNSDIDDLVLEWDMITGKYRGREIVHSYHSSGLYKASFTVRDDDGAVSRSHIEILVENAQPVADAGEDRVLTTNIAELDGSGSWDTPSDRRNLTFAWDMGDGNTDTGETISHEYSRKGSYRVVLKVTDDDGKHSLDTIDVSIENLAPEAVFESPAEVDEDEAFILDGAGSSDDDGEIGSFVWNLGDVRREGRTIEHAFHSSGEYDLTLEVFDDQGARGWLRRTISVINSAPSADAGPDNETLVGRSIILDGRASTDTPSDLRNLTYVWKLPDGTILYGEVVEVVFGEAGNFTIELTVEDVEGLVSMDTVKVWVWGSILESIDLEFDLDTYSCHPGDPVRAWGKVEYNFREGGERPDLNLAVVNIHAAGETYRVVPDIHGNFEIVFAAPAEEGTHYIICTVSRFGMLKEESRELRVQAESEPANLISIATSPAVMGGASVVLAAGGLSAAVLATDIGRWKFFALLIPLYSRIKRDDVLDNFERGRIYQYILLNPGDYFSHIKKILDLRSGTLTYHLKVLEQREFISSRTDGKVKRFYPYGMKVEHGPHRDIQELILEYLTIHPGMTQKDIAGELGIHVSTVNYHINMMVGAGILVSDRRERVQRYEVQYLARELPMDS
ncbi:MAG: PKD domain-containing protein [Thermoplasmatota archaeon]